jgi:patatin-like phospholipase/acyl hydrolase
MSKYRILALDGGGIRGVLTASVLERLEAEFPEFLSNVDLFAGTSTGGILALGLASGLSPRELRELYEESANQVFVNKPARYFIEQFEQFREKFDQFYVADYPNQPLKQALINKFGSKTLGDLQKKVLITSFDLDDGGSHNYPRRWQPKIFANFGEDPDKAQKIVDVALYTSSAPSYFPIYQGFVDGGVIANNPSMCALAQAIRKDEKGGKQSLKNIRLLSLGTGTNSTFLDVVEERGNWGYLQWLMGGEAPEVFASGAVHGAILRVMLEGTVALADYQCRQILGKSYHRFDPLLEKPIALDAIDKIDELKSYPRLEKMAEKREWESTAFWVKRNFLTD